MEALPRSQAANGSIRSVAAVDERRTQLHVHQNILSACQLGGSIGRRCIVDGAEPGEQGGSRKGGRPCRHS